MEDSRFDRLTGELAQRIERRQVVLGASTGLAALLATDIPHLVDAGKKKSRKKRKKKQGLCTSAYGQKLRCKPSQCCAPGSSTIAACTEIGFPTCCASSGLAHPLGTTCCSSYFHGIEGICTTDYPICCSGSLGGGCCLPNTTCCNAADFGGERFCCPAERPICCPLECCPVGDTCAGNFCASSVQRGDSRVPGSHPVSGQAPSASPPVTGNAFAEPAR